MKAGCKIDFAGFCRNGFPVLCKDSEIREKTGTSSRFSEADPIFCKDIKITLKSGVYFCFLFGFFIIVGKVWGAAGRNPGI